MGTINFPGLATGIDTTQIVKQLMAINSRRSANYKVDKLHLSQKETAVGELKTKVGTLEKAADALSDTEKLETFKSSSSHPNRLGIATTSAANPGSHSIEINQLATAETWIQDLSSFDFDTELVGAGIFIYSYNYKERTITATATTTLADFIGLINNDEENPGVTASLLNQGGKQHLLLNGRDTGEDFQISVNAKNTEVWKPDSGSSDPTFLDDGENASLTDKIIDLDQWTDAHTGTETITISGTNNAGTTILPSRVLSITADTTLGQLIKDINYYFEGIANARLENGQVVLTDYTSGTSSLSMSLTYAANGSAASLGLPTMVVSTEGGSTSESLTSLTSTSFTQTQNAQNSEIKIDNFTPTAVAEVQTLTPDAVATAGTYTLTYGGETTSALNYNASTTDVQTALNALSTISAIGNVTVGGNDLTSTSGMTVTFASSAGNTSMISINIGSLTGPTAVTVSETTRGNNEEWVSRNSNIITDALTGTTLILQDVNDVDTSSNIIPIEITISRDTGGVKAKVNRLVSSYNSVLTYLKEKTEYNVETKSLGMFSNDIAVTLIKTQMKAPFLGVLDGFSSEDPYFQVSDIGLSFDGRGAMTFDESKFNDAIEDDYLAVIELLGAAAKGRSNSDTVEFHSASELYTTPTTYNFTVTVASGVVTVAQIKLSTESIYRDMTIDGNLVSGNDSFDSTGFGPIHPENGLFLQVDLSSDGTFTGNVTVKRGVGGALEKVMDDIIEADGRLDVTSAGIADNIRRLEGIIEKEEKRLEKLEDRLVARFARLEKNLQLLQRQLAAVGALSSAIFR